jgi:predicted nucleotidyltransferase component of viral defense system
MLRVWQIPQSRLTRDIDLLGFTRNTAEHIAEIVRDICQVAAPDDGITYPIESVAAEVIRQRSHYVGIRVQFVAQSGQAIVPMQIDIGFADRVTPLPEMIEYPVTLDFPAPKLCAYPRETTIAEKFHAMIDHGYENTRIKDFYDLWQMSRHFSFSGEQLYAAIIATFLQRQTDLPTDTPIAFTNDFIADARKEAQWKAFMRKMKLGEDAPAWSTTVQTIRDWLWPLLVNAQVNTPILINWQPNLGWC